VTRLDSVPLGIVVNRDGERFYDEGEDFWPKRYAVWGRFVADQPDQVAYSIVDAKAIGRFMPPVFTGQKSDTIEGLARVEQHSLADSAHAAFVEPAGEHLAVDLAVDVQWKFSHSDYSLGDHFTRQPLSQPLYQRTGVD